MSVVLAIFAAWAAASGVVAIPLCRMFAVTGDPLDQLRHEQTNRQGTVAVSENVRTHASGDI